MHIFDAPRDAAQACAAAVAGWLAASIAARGRATLAVFGADRQYESALRRLPEVLHAYL